MSASNAHKSSGEWTEAKTAELRRLWHDGVAAAEIASRLGGISKSAVLGKASRMALPQRRRAMTGQSNTRRSPSTRAETTVGRPTRRDTDAEGVKFLAGDVWKPLPGSNPVRLEQVEGCRWPLGSIDDDTFRMCNEAKAGGASYCPIHKRASEPKW